MLNTYVTFLRPSASCVFREKDVVSFGKCHTMKHEQQRTALIYSIFIFKQRVREQHTVAQPFTLRLSRKLM